MRKDPYVQLDEALNELETLRAQLAAERARANELADELHDIHSELDAARSERDTLRAESERLRKALNTAMWAMRQPLDEWKGECERKALDEARAALAEVGR